MNFIQADTSSGCWSLPAHSGNKKPLWEIPPRRKVGGSGSAFFFLEESNSGKRGFQGLVIDADGRIYGPRKCNRPQPVEDSKSKSLQGAVSLGKRAKVTTDVQVFVRANGTFAMVEVLKLDEIPEQFRAVPQEPERVVTPPVFQIPVHQAPSTLLPPAPLYPELTQIG